MPEQPNKNQLRQITQTDKSSCVELQPADYSLSNTLVTRTSLINSEMMDDLVDIVNSNQQIQVQHGADASASPDPKSLLRLPQMTQSADTQSDVASTSSFTINGQTTANDKADPMQKLDKSLVSVGYNLTMRHPASKPSQQMRDDDSSCQLSMEQALVALHPPNQVYAHLSANGQHAG
jgi:hypothetical protein